MWVLTAITALSLLSAAPEEIRGRVIDRNGAAVSGARITVAGSDRVVTTDADGLFQIHVSGPPPVVLTITAPEFLSRRHLVGDSGQWQQIRLEPQRYHEQITVTATRSPSRVRSSASSVILVDGEQLQTSPTVDDALRQVPGFTLFRRSGSRTANPTAQGASLRGIGASGASRAVVLDDGIPLNDPFGGWVYWGRVPRASLARIEVLRGGASELYGSGALSGVVQLIRRSDGEAFRALTSFGSDETTEASFYSALPLGEWSLTSTAELFRTDGYVTVAPADRGAVDRQANSRRAVGEITLTRSLEDRFRFFVRAALFDEARENGTPLQTNNTSLRQLSAGGTWSLGSGATADLRAFVMGQTYHQSFSAVSPDRSSERLTRLQRVPVNACGAGLQMTQPLASHLLIGGFEIRQVEGFTHEEIFSANVTRIEAGGTQTSVGVFVEDLFLPHPRLTITAAVRFDAWQNREARRVSGAELTRFPDREETSFSPRLAALYRLDERFSLTASAYRAFRAPTLNELYRSFRVGNILTLANENLRAERLNGVEGGLMFTAGRLHSRLNLFEMVVKQNVANVTLGIEPDLITRQRQNLGKTRSRGLELDLQTTAGPLGIQAGYLWVDARVEDFPANRELEGLRVPQVPRHQASIQMRIDEIAAQIRWVGTQLEDDQNQFRLDRYLLADLFAGRRLTERTQIFLAIENLFDRRFEVGKTPLTTIGPGRSLRLGIRVD